MPSILKQLSSKKGEVAVGQVNWISPKFTTHIQTLLEEEIEDDDDDDDELEDDELTEELETELELELDTELELELELELSSSQHLHGLPNLLSFTIISCVYRVHVFIKGH